MTNEEMILKIVKDKGYISGNIVKEMGIDTWYLSSLLQKGKLQRIAKGLYSDQEGIHDEYFVFQYQHSKALFSYSTALFFMS